MNNLFHLHKEYKFRWRVGQRAEFPLITWKEAIPATYVSAGVDAKIAYVPMI